MASRKKPAHNRHGTFLRNWRKFRELTLQRAADRLDIDYTTLGRIERGEVPYNQDLLERLAFAYGCEVTDLLDIDPLKPDPPKLVYSRLRHASPEVQRQALAIIEALLRSAA
jgi:transcriptional regulator with XRE-family HTH domain